MNGLRFDFDWVPYPDSAPYHGDTTAQLKLFLAGHCITKNEDIWSRTVRDQISVSLYPLAMWLASSWWRLNYETLPDTQHIPSTIWRMNHEVAAANCGYVWPKILLATDRERMLAWVESSRSESDNSVKYLFGSSEPFHIELQDFGSAARSLIESVIARLTEVGSPASELEELWRVILEDYENPAELKKRILEAELGFDPEECPEETLRQALELSNRVGQDTLAELAAAYSQQENSSKIGMIEEALSAPGIIAEPESLIETAGSSASGHHPWQRGVAAAKRVRISISNTSDPISDTDLYRILGIAKISAENWETGVSKRASIGSRGDSKAIRLVPRKKHPISKRFELARFVADIALVANEGNNDWLVSTDLSTARQKYQRAFAAEFLCPIESLKTFMSGDFSDDSIAEAADAFRVSERTVNSLLMNNGIVRRPPTEPGLPYAVA